jgi:hypothetical protein
MVPAVVVLLMLIVAGMFEPSNMKGPLIWVGEIARPASALVGPFNSSGELVTFVGVIVNPRAEAGTVTALLPLWSANRASPENGVVAPVSRTG